MKISVKTLKGKHFDLNVNPSDTVTAVKKQIEESQGKESFPCSQQLLIHQGKVLKDDTSMEDNKVSENGFLVVMLTKVKAPAAATPSSCGTVEVSAEDLQPTPTPSPVGTASATNPASSLAPAPALAVVPTAVPTPVARASELTGDTYGQAASNVVAGTNLE
jgi:UV excision repair protein RAD23